MILSNKREVTKMENFVSAVIGAFAEDFNVSKEEMMADFDNFNKAIDEKLQKAIPRERQ